MTSSFIICYCRLFVDILPFLVISPNLAKKMFYVCDLEKYGVLHVKLTFETTLIFYMNAEAKFSVIFLQTI